MNGEVRPQEHHNLYFIFQADQAAHTMPEEKKREMFALLQSRINKSTVKGESP